MMRFSYREKRHSGDVLVWTEEIDGIGVPLIEECNADEFYAKMLRSAPVITPTKIKTFRLRDLENI